MQTEDIKFKNITYNIEGNSILYDIKGQFKKNRLTAILGASGSGKTTLLEILSGRRECEGRYITMGAYNLSSKALQSIVSFSKNNDVLPTYETVEEALNLSADLSNVKYNIDKELTDLNIENKKKTMIKDLSHGEQKRVSTALELVHNPSLIFLDEPLSGLDAYSAIKTLRYLKNLCDCRTIVMTIHQPSSSMLYEFDDLLVLKDGRSIFYGTVEELFVFFNEKGASCPHHFNPCEHLFFKVLPGIIFPEIEINSSDNDNAKGFRLETDIKYNIERPSVKYQAKLLLIRKTRTTYRKKTEFYNILTSAVFSLMIGAIFYNLGNKPPLISDPDVSGLFNILSIAVIFHTALKSLSSIYDGKSLFLKEYINGNYPLIAHYISNEAVDWLVLLIDSTLFSVILSVVLSLNYSVSRYLYMLVYVFLGMIIGRSFGIIFAYIMNSYEASSSFLPAFLVFLAIFSGGFKRFDICENYMGYIQYLSPFWYLYNGFIGNHCVYEDIDSSYPSLHFAKNISSLIFMAIVFYLIGYFVVYFKYSKCIKKRR